VRLFPSLNFSQGGQQRRPGPIVTVVLPIAICFSMSDTCIRPASTATVGHQSQPVRRRVSVKGGFLRMTSVRSSGVTSRMSLISVYCTGMCVVSRLRPSTGFKPCVQALCQKGAPMPVLAKRPGGAAVPAFTVRDNQRRKYNVNDYRNRRNRSVGT